MHKLFDVFKSALIGGALCTLSLAALGDVYFICGSAPAICVSVIDEDGDVETHYGNLENIILFD